MQGKCLWFDSEKQFGFILPDGDTGKKGVFVHQNDIKNSDMLRKHDIVGFEIERQGARQKAVDVFVLEAAT